MTNKTIPEVRQAIAQAVRKKLDEYTEAIADLRKREDGYRRADGQSGDGGELPGDAKPQDQTPDDSGHGGDAERAAQRKKAKKLFKRELKKAAKKYAADALAKGDVPMAKPPAGGVPGAAPTSKPTAPKVGAPMGKNMAGGYPSASATSASGASQSTMPMGKGEAHLPANFPRLSKALDGAGKPRLGGKDPASKAMTQHAASAAPTAVPAAAPAGPKLTPDDQARRAAELSSFTPAGAFTPGKSVGGVVAGPMEPGAAPGAVPAPVPAPAPAVGKPVGTSAAPAGPLDRFKAAMQRAKGGVPGAAPVAKGELSTDAPATEQSMAKGETCRSCGMPKSQCKCAK